VWHRAAVWSRPARAALALLGLALLALAPSPSSADEASELQLSIDSPKPDTVIGDPGGMAFLAGKALALFGEYRTFDIIFVIDTSESTSAPSGADIDGDGKIGHRRGEEWLTIFGKVLPLPNSDGGDSILAAEVQAVRILMEQLDPRTTRVGVVAFSGDRDPMTEDAFTLVPLTSDYRQVQAGLEDLLSAGPNGMTNMASGVQRGLVELLGSYSAYSEKRDEARRIMLFLTDGNPTLPFDGHPAANMRSAISKAVKAREARVRIDTYAIGSEALSEPVVAVEMARVTYGNFTPVRHPKDLRAVFEDVSFADIERLEVRNRTTGADAAYAIRNADGSFAALVPMREGRNVIEVFARATDGSEARRAVPVRFVREGEIQPLTPRLVAQRNRLLENQLLDLQRRRLQIESERDDKIRRDLQLEIEAEREAAEKRAAEAKKRLRIEVEE
jgi:Mg-chelatase subunit ChlD